LKDVVEIINEVKTFTIISAARTIILEAQTSAEHDAWLEQLGELCQQATFRGTRPKRRTSSDLAQEKPMLNQPVSTITTESMDKLSISQEAETKASFGSTSLFSRYGNGEKNSFYAEEPTSTQNRSLRRTDTLTDNEVIEKVNSSLEDVMASLDNPTPRNLPHSEGIASLSLPTKAASKDDHRRGGFHRGTGSQNPSISNRIGQCINQEETGHSKLGSQK
jgi:hypothetical protein